MISLLSIVLLGFALGMRHATDPDHVIAVTTIVARHRKVSHAALIGAFWGCGHTVTNLIVGGGIILFGWVIPARIGLSMEFSIGLMLIGLGALNLTGVLRWSSPAFSSPGGMSGMLQTGTHNFNECLHVHAHDDDLEIHSRQRPHDPRMWFARQFGIIGVRQALRPLVVGIVHGLAGSAAVALLVLSTIRNPRWAVMYLLVFGAGTIAGMMVITGVLVMPFAYANTRLSRLNGSLRVGSGLVSVGFGLFLVYQIGFVDRLFASHPLWIPH